MKGLIEFNARLKPIEEKLANVFASNFKVIVLPTFSFACWLQQAKEDYGAPAICRCCLVCSPGWVKLELATTLCSSCVLVSVSELSVIACVQFKIVTILPDLQSNMATSYV